MTSTAVAAQADASPGGMGIPFTVASRPQRRYANVQSVNNLSSGGSFQVIQVPASGWVRGFSLFFTQTVTFASGGTLVTGDSPWNLINNVTVTDATGQPIIQPISGFGLYLKNKYSGRSESVNFQNPGDNPMMSPEYAFATSTTLGGATFRLDLDFEVDSKTGYGCIPNLDSNASLQIKVDYNAYTQIATGTTPSDATLSMRVTQRYWAPVGSSVGGAPVDNAPPGAGDYLETRYETQTVSASAENLITLTNRGGLIKSIILVSRAAGVRTAPTAGANLGILLDNQPIYEGVPIEEFRDETRRMFGYFGADLTTTYAPLTPGVMPGLDRGVVAINFGGMSGGRDSWLNTRAGSLLQLKFTPGASATTVEVYTELMQVKDPSSFYNAGA